ncbi:MAG: FMN-binding negative transcriptional regulator [Myxococcota bacterium]|nr:FMN-binding negative transcriptional regulator [Myxococcota bacterium]
MYTPTHFAEEDTELLYSFMQNHPFATLVTNQSDGPLATHLPVEVEKSRDGNQGRILGHLARANPHWELFDSPDHSLLIFHGPHNYISPAWYESKNMVPTWNYAAVHAYGRIHLIDEPDEVRGVLDALVDRFESQRATPWVNELDDEFMNQLQAAIVAFEFKIEKLEGKFKLGQNRRLVDQKSALLGLESETSNIELASLTRQRLKQDAP